MYKIQIHNRLNITIFNKRFITLFIHVNNKILNRKKNFLFLFLEYLEKDFGITSYEP